MGWAFLTTTCKIEVAAKKVSHESRQGIREFVVKITSVGRLRHRNLVQLLGYCRREEEILLVYDFMPNGSLDKFLFDQPKVTLNWTQRFRIIEGVALGLFYLHEECEQAVVHREVMASIVLLDGEINGGLGDFGLARLYDHGTNPQTTHVVGTLGYLAPKLSRTGKATTNIDVFAFGAFLLEVACGKRPIESQASSAEDLNLVDWVFSCWNIGVILETSDPKEMELVLKLELVCSQSLPVARPSMRQVVQFLNGDLALTEMSSLGLSDSTSLAFGQQFESFVDFTVSYPYSSLEKAMTVSSSIADSLISEGR